MLASEVALRRLSAQQITAPEHSDPATLISSMVAMQAQDYLGALWSVGLRLKDAREADIERAIAERRLVRSWPMRGTLHFVAPDDLRWLLSLLAPRVIARAARRYDELELDDRAFSQSRRLLERALAGGTPLSRPEAYRVLEEGHVSTAGQRGIHLIQRLALDAVLCFGPREGKQQTFVLLDEWAPRSKKLPPRDQALFELARRYFTGHGPASVADFTWWSGLPVAEAREAIELARGELDEVKVEETLSWSGRRPSRRRPPPSHHAHLLPGFDELLLGYEDRSALLDASHREKINPGLNGMLNPTLVLDGRVAGTWKRTLSAKGVSVVVDPFGPLGKKARPLMASAAERYARYLGQPLLELRVGSENARLTRGRAAPGNR